MDWANELDTIKLRIREWGVRMRAHPLEGFDDATFRPSQHHELLTCNNYAHIALEERVLLADSFEHAGLASDAPGDKLASVSTKMSQDRRRRFLGISAHAQQATRGV